MQNQTWQFRWPFFFFFFFFLSSSFISELSIGRKKMMMMVPSKAKAQGDLKVSRLNRNGSTKSDAQHSSSPLPKPRGSVDRPTKSFESKASSKNSTSSPSKPGLQGKLEAVEVELKKAREQLSSVEQEKIKALEHMNEAKRLMNEEVEKTEEILDAERRRIKELEEELQKEQQHLLRVKEELRGAKAEKEMALREVDEAKRAAKVHEEKAELASKEACDLKALHESELGSVRRESREMIEKLEAEIGMLKLELERVKIAEEKLVHMESLVEKLQIEATDARNGESDVCALVDEWRNKAERLKADLEEAHQSENSASDSLADMMVKLEESKSLFEDAEMEISILRARISTLEIESARQMIDLEESNRQLELAQQDALNIGKTVELLKLELQRLEEEKLEAANVEKVASSRIQSLAEENDKLTAELKLSKDEMECLALEFKAMAIGAREREERLTRMQTEIEESHKEIDHLNRVLRNTEERYEVMLDEARYELVCLHKRCEDEQSFISTIRKLEEEITSLKAEMAKHEKNESIEDVEQANSSPDKEEEEYTEEEDHYQEGHDMKGTTNGKVDPVKIMDDGFGLEEETVDDDLDSKMNSNGVDHTNRTEQQKLRRKKKKKALLYNFGILLKKGNH